ncbi:MAG: hypothetical protein ABIR00_03455 [Nitrosospira sp.]
MTDGERQAASFPLTGGNIVDDKGKAAGTLLADQAYDSDAIRRFIKDQYGLEHPLQSQLYRKQATLSCFAPSAHGFACESAHSAYRCMA